MEIRHFCLKKKTEVFFYTILDELEMLWRLDKKCMLSLRCLSQISWMSLVTRSKIVKNLNFEDLGNLPDMDELVQMSPDEFLKDFGKISLRRARMHGGQIFRSSSAGSGRPPLL